MSFGRMRFGGKNEDDPPLIFRDKLGYNVQIRHWITSRTDVMDSLYRIKISQAFCCIWKRYSPGSQHHLYQLK
jgi:hypothetical protein